MTIGLLISGNLGNIILSQLLHNNSIKLLFVFTDFKSQAIIDACRVNNIPLFSGNPRNNRSSDFLAGVDSPQLILSVNYLFIIEKDVILKAKKYAINIHGSLLPKYRGRTPHVWAIINNEKLTGVTAHLITEGCDEGDIVLQKEVPILESYTGQDLLEKFNALYPLIVEEIILLVKEGPLKLVPQEHNKSSFFEKRTPEDGKIDFLWQKERIFNWVRAQSKPYPGAFCFLNDHKVVVHKVSFSDFAFHQSMQNGLVLDVEQNACYVKTQNGVIKLFELETNLNIKKGDVLQ